MFAKLKQKTIEEKVVSPRSAPGRQQNVQVSLYGSQTRLWSVPEAYQKRLLF